MTEEINKELEKCLDELFPKNRIKSEKEIINKLNKFFNNSFTPNFGYDEKSLYGNIFELIKEIQKESGRDKALVLFALAQKKINELEEKVEELEDDINRSIIRGY